MERIEKLERLIPKLKNNKKINPLKTEAMEWELRALKAEEQLNNCNLQNVSGSDKLILIKRINPTEYEIHRGEIRQTKNLILTTTDSDFAHKLVNAYNHYR